LKPSLVNNPTLLIYAFSDPDYYAKKPGKGDAKHDHHTSNGAFIGYTATTKNVYFIDDKTYNVKMGTHALLFDEAHFTGKSTIGSTSTMVLRVGYSNFDNE
jgi:hypothetical protein